MGSSEWERLKSIDDKLVALTTGIPLAKAQYDELIQALRALHTPSAPAPGDGALEDAYRTMRQALLK